MTWSVGFETGSSPVKRWKGLVLDRYIGEEYKKGLEKLKQRVEADRAPTTVRQNAPAPAPASDPAPAQSAPSGGETVVPETAPAQAPPQ